MKNKLKFNLGWQNLALQKQSVSDRKKNLRRKNKMKCYKNKKKKRRKC